jgi:hypothetical protein
LTVCTFVGCRVICSLQHIFDTTIYESAPAALQNFLCGK